MTVDLEARIEAEIETHQKKLAQLRSDLLMLRDEDEETGSPIAPVHLNTFLDENPGGEMPWLAHPLLIEGGVSLVLAQGGVGKTTLVTQLALSIAAGRHMAAIQARIADPATVLYIAAEGARIAYRGRVETARKAMGVDRRATRWFIQPESFIDYQIGSRGLETLVLASKCKLLILDTLGYFWKGDRNSDGEWKDKVMQPLRSLIARTGTHVMLVHHLGKNPDDWRGRGTSAMFDDADFVLTLEAGDANTVSNPLDLPVKAHVRKNKYGISNYHYDLAYHTDKAIFEPTY